MWGKYMRIFNLQIKENLLSRFNVFSSSIYIVIPLISHLFIWKAMYFVGEGTELLAMYTLNEIITYTILGHFIDKLSNEVLTQLKISGDIKKGEINRYLVLPIHPFFSEMASHMANTIHTAITIIVGYAVIAVVFGSNIILRADFIHLVFVLLNIATAVIIGFLLNYIIGMMTFWMKDIMSLYIFTQSTFLFLSGGYMPIDLLPEAIFGFLMVTPFPYLLYFPASIYVKNLTVDNMIQGTLIGFFWVAVLFIISFSIYNKGLERYEAQST